MHVYMIVQGRCKMNKLLIDCNRPVYCKIEEIHVDTSQKVHLELLSQQHAAAAQILRRSFAYCNLQLHAHYMISQRIKLICGAQHEFLASHCHPKRP